jgi:predicted phage tail component-like protein
MLGFTYNGIHSSTYGIVAKSVNRPILPVLRSRQLVIPGRHGTYDFADNTFENRTIEVDLKYIGTSFAEFRSRAREIAYWLSGYGGNKNLVFDDELDKWYSGKIYSEIGLSNLFKIGECSVQFEVEPFAYATLEEYDTTEEYDTGELYDAGLIYPNERTVYDWTFLAPYFNVRNGDSREWCGFPWSYNPHMTSLYNWGTIKTPFTITIYGSVTNPITIYQETTSASITISAAMTAGSTMVIDTDTITVTYNGTNYLNYVSGDIDNFNLEVGANGFFFYGINPQAEVTFDFEQRFL